jgi:hypothetical protein
MSLLNPLHKLNNSYGLFCYGKLTGYGGGIEHRQWLLNHERLMRMKQVAKLAGWQGN